jgi:hypothetical protein
MSLDKPKLLSESASPKETAIWCANLLAQCVHNWNVAQSWFEMLSAQLKDIEQRVEARNETPAHREKLASVHDLEEVAERIEHVVESGNRGALNSERVREITETVVTKRGFDDLSQSAKDRKQFYLSVLLAVIAAVLGVIGGRLLPH